MWGKSSIPLRGISGRTRHTKIQALPGVDTDRHQEHLRAAPSHDIVPRDNNIPQLCKSWDENITDLVSGIPLELLVVITAKQPNQFSKHFRRIRTEIGRAHV